MSRENEEPKGSSGVTFRVPDFVGEDGVVYSEIEVLVELDGGTRDAAKLAESLQRPLKTGLTMSVGPPGAALDCVTRGLIEHGVPLTQRNWITFAYLGAKSSIDELDAEELADLPEGLEDWPEDTGHVN